MIPQWHIHLVLPIHMGRFSFFLFNGREASLCVLVNCSVRSATRSRILNIKTLVAYWPMQLRKLQVRTLPAPSEQKGAIRAGADGTFAGLIL